MEALKQFPEEYSRSFEASFGFLKMFNIRYLQDDQPFLKKQWRFFYIIPIVLTHLFTMGVHMVVLITKDQIIGVAYMLPLFLISLQATLKALIIIPKTTEISEIIKDLGVLWRTNLMEEQNTERNGLLKRLNFFNKANAWVTIFGSIQYLISPLLETLFKKFILHQQCALLLPISASYPFNSIENWLTYGIVYMFQFYALFMLVFVYMGSEFIMVTLIALLSAEFAMIKYDLARADPSLNRKMKKQEDEYSIGDFVKRHQKLIRLSRRLDNVFNQMIFVDVLFVGITTCAFHFAAEFARGPMDMLINYVGVSASIFNILYLCYYAELLTRASACLGDVAYQNLWYKGDSQYKRATWLIIKICQNPCCMTSLQYAVVSLNLFTKVVSTTWSYFSLMNSVYTIEED